MTACRVCEGAGFVRAIRTRLGKARTHALAALLVHRAQPATRLTTVTHRGCRTASRPRSTKTAGGIDLVYAFFRAHRAAERQEADHAGRCRPLHSEATQGPTRPAPLARRRRAFDAGFGRLTGLADVRPHVHTAGDEPRRRAGVQLRSQRDALGQAEAEADQ